MNEKKKSIIKKLKDYITAPKITIYLKSGNIVRTRLFPYSSYDADNIVDLLNRQYGDIIPHENRESLSYRKWWQRWE